jgi:hypothetical protein
MYTDYSLLDAAAGEQLAAEAQAGGPTTGTTRIGEEIRIAFT